jgi:indolepyruvate ferredoxin oxidoreductase beta subunit
VAVDAEELAKVAGNKVAANVVMLGALMGRGGLPIPVEVMKSAIGEKVPKKAFDLNMKAFDLGFEAVKIA